MANEKTIEILLKLNDQMKKTLDVSTDAMERASKAAGDLEKKTKNVETAQNASAKATSGAVTAFTGLAGGLIATAAAYVSINTVIGAYKTAILSSLKASAEFEQSLANTKAILQPTEEEFRALAYSAKELGRTTVFTASQAGDAYTELGKLGFDASQILAAGNDVLTLAAAANLEMADAATAAATVVRQFGLEAGQTGEVVDTMAKAFSISALDADNFTEAMQYVGPAARAAKISVAETSAALGVLADNGIKGSMAGTSLRRIMMELSDENSKASKIIAEINPNAQTLAEKFEALKKAGIDNASAAKLFRVEASSAALVLADSAQKIADYGDQLRYAEGGAKGFAKGVADIQLDTLQGDLKLAESQLEGVQIAFGEAFGDVARKSVQLVTGKLGELSQWMEENPEKLRKWAEAAETIFRGVVKTVEILAGGVQALNNAISSLTPDNKSNKLTDQLISATNDYGKALSDLRKYRAEIAQFESKSALYRAWNKDEGVTAGYASVIAEKRVKDSEAAINSLKQQIKLQTESGLLDEKSVKEMNEVVKISEYAYKAGVSYAKMQKDISKAQADALKKQAAGRAVTAKGAGATPIDPATGIDTDSQQKALKEQQEAAKKAEIQYRQILRDREIAEMTASQQELARLTYKWDDIIAIEKAGGGRHLEQLEKMRDEEIAAMLRTGEVSQVGTFEGRGLAIGYNPAPVTDGGEDADESRRMAYERASQDDKEAAEALLKELEDSKKSEYQLEEEAYQERLSLLRRFHLDEEILTEQHNERIRMINAMRITEMANFAGSLATLSKAVAGDNKKALMAYKILATAEATMNTYVAANKAFATAGGWPWGVIPAATSIATGLANVAVINGVHFEQGSKSTDAAFGLVPGNSYYGDQVPAMLSSGEMVLSRNEAKKYQQGMSNSGPVNMTYAPTYNGNVSPFEKRNDMRYFKKMMRTAQDDRSFGRTQGAMTW